MILYFSKIGKTFFPPAQNSSPPHLSIVRIFVRFTPSIVKNVLQLGEVDETEINLLNDLKAEDEFPPIAPCC